MLTFCNLFSGSGGNATYIGTEQDAVLVDCGMSCKAVREAMRFAGLEESLLRGVLVTHEHSDHIRGLEVFCRTLHLPVIAAEGTQQALDKCLSTLPREQRLTFRSGESFFCGSLECQSIPTSHDAADPVAYRIFAGSLSAACATDLGVFSREVSDALEGTQAVLLESNHDPDMLRSNPHYPANLVRRILGKRGHLSNESAAAAAVALVRTGTRHLQLGHLSKENNTPALAYQTSLQALTEAGLETSVTLHVARPDGPAQVFRVSR